MRNAVIFGAGSEIASAVVGQLLGYNFILLGRNLAELSRQKQDLMVKYPSIVVEELYFDAKQNDYTSLIAAIQAKFQQIDLLLIAHGTLPDQHSCQKNWHETLEALQVNALSVLNLCHHLAAIFEQQQSGSMVVIGSVAGDRGRQSNYVYGTAKGMLNIYLQGLRNRLAKSNVQVLTVKPGFVATKMTAALGGHGVLWSRPQKVAADIVRAIDSRRNIIYTPWFWRILMLIICSIPERVFKKMKL